MFNTLDRIIDRLGPGTKVFIEKTEDGFHVHVVSNGHFRPINIQRLFALEADEDILVDIICSEFERSLAGFTQ